MSHNQQIAATLSRNLPKKASSLSPWERAVGEGWRSQVRAICPACGGQYVRLTECILSLRQSAICPGSRMAANVENKPYIRRHVECALTEALKDTPVVCILGPRQCGKSTRALRQAPARTYLSLDDQNIFHLAHTDAAPGSPPTGIHISCAVGLEVITSSNRQSRVVTI